MKISIKQFAALGDVADVTIHSLEQALYQVTVALTSGPHLLVDHHGKTVRSRSLQSMREMLQTLPVRTITLRHESAYDEMIGQPVKQSNNTLEISLSHDLYPEPTIH